MMKQNIKELKNLSRVVANQERLIKSLEGKLHRLQGRSTSAKHMLVMSDIQDGSSKAVCSLEPIISAKETVHQLNREQFALNDGWVQCHDHLEKKRSNLAVLNGEGIDGANRHQDGNQSWTTDYMDQVVDAQKLIEMYNYDKFYVLGGSKYHTVVGATNFDEVLAKLLGAVPYKMHGGKGTVDQALFIDIPHGGQTTRVNFTHHVGFSKDEGNRANSIQREIVRCQMYKSTQFDIGVRSHDHYFQEVRTRYANQRMIRGIITPCWKLADDFMFRGGMPTESHIGMVEFIFETNGKVEIIPIIVDITDPKDVRHPIKLRVDRLE